MEINYWDGDIKWVLGALKVGETGYCQDQDMHFIVTEIPMIHDRELPPLIHVDVVNLISGKLHCMAYDIPIVKTEVKAEIKKYKRISNEKT